MKQSLCDMEPKCKRQKRIESIRNGTKHNCNAVHFVFCALTMRVPLVCVNVPVANPSVPAIAEKHGRICDLFAPYVICDRLLCDRVTPYL